MIIDGNDWGKRYSKGTALFVGPHPNITLDDGTVVSGDEVLFLESYPYLDGKDQQRKEYIIDQQKGVQRYNDAYDQALSRASQAVSNHLHAKLPQETKPGRIVPTLRVGDLPNAAGKTPYTSLYKVV